MFAPGGISGALKTRSSGTDQSRHRLWTRNHLFDWHGYTFEMEGRCSLSAASPSRPARAEFSLAFIGTTLTCFRPCGRRRGLLHLQDRPCVGSVRRLRNSAPEIYSDLPSIKQLGFGMSALTSRARGQGQSRSLTAHRGCRCPIKAINSVEISFTGGSRVSVADPSDSPSSVLVMTCSRRHQGSSSSLLGGPEYAIADIHIQLRRLLQEAALESGELVHAAATQKALRDFEVRAERSLECVD